MEGFANKGKFGYDVRSARAWLRQYRENEREIDNQNERLERINTKLYGIGSPQINDMPRNPSPSNDRADMLLNAKQELIDEIDELVKWQRTEKAAIESNLKKLKKADERAVIRARYLDCETWESIANMLFGGNEDYLEKEDSYLRRAYKLHEQAIIDMTETPWT